MEIVIHGTKDGYRTLFATNDELARIIARDIRKGAQGDDQLGKTAYSLAFVANGCVYTKYVIVKDSLRSFATGTIAFSLFIGEKETMKAVDIFKLLNELYSFYESKYIKNNYLNRGETELIREDWNFVNEILSKYRTEPKTARHEDINSGTQDPAVIYYQDDNKLSEYFDKPFQVEYSDYSQVLFIQNSLQGITNPINVIKNSGVELKDIDLKNESYYLNNYNRSKGITITANGKPRSEGKNNNSIRAKDIVEIYYSRDEQCYEPIYAKGTLFDPQIEKYLKIRNNDIIIEDGAFLNPVPIKRTLHIEVRHRKGYSVNDAEVLYWKDGSYDKKKITENKIEFSGSELKENWIFFSRKDEVLFSEQQPIVPAQQNEKIILTLNEHKSVSFFVTNPEIIKNHIKVNIWGIKNPPTSDRILFVGDEIERTHNITFSTSRYEDKTISYNPQNNQPIQVTLQKQKKYNINAGEFGEKVNGCPSWSNHSNGSDIDNKKYIKPNKGYVFTGWKLDAENVLTAQYKKKKSFFRKPKVMTGMATLFLALCVGIWFLFFNNDSKVATTSITENQIEAYVEGDELLLNNLNSYKAQWANQKPEISEKSTGIFGMFGFGEKQTDSTEYEKWQKTDETIDRAIFKRKKIDSKEFKLVLDSLRFSDNQLLFKETLQKMDSLHKADSLQYENVKSKLSNISSLKLSEITATIDSILNPPKVDEAEEQTSEKEEQPKETAQKVTEEKQQTNVQTGQSQGATIKNSEITQYLKDSELKEETLESYKNKTTNQNLKKSIDLALKLWDLDGSSSKSYLSYRRELQNDDILKESQLLEFVKEMCDSQKTPSPKYWGNISGNKNKSKTLETLKRQ